MLSSRRALFINIILMRQLVTASLLVHAHIGSLHAHIGSLHRHPRVVAIEDPVAKVEQYFRLQPSPVDITIIADEVAGADLQLQLWCWLADGTAAPTEAMRVLLVPFPSSPETCLTKLTDMLDKAGSERLPRLQPLPPELPTGLMMTASESPASDTTGVPYDDDDDNDDDEEEKEEEATEARTRAWVDRTLSPSGLSFCPFTESSDLSAIGLETSGVMAAPIRYATCTSESLADLMAEFWEAVCIFMAEGEEGCSSVILSAPRWDSESGWDDWREVVFPLLEASVEASGLDRELGVVCFHPLYKTPSDEWLEHSSFGHLHRTSRLRDYLNVHDAELAAKTSDEELLWAGSYQRRSPHAMINLLWASQLEIAEARRSPSVLYTRNIRLALAHGRQQLEQAAEAERGLLASSE